MNIRRAIDTDINKISDLLSQVLTIHHTIRPDIFKPNAVKYLPEELREIIKDDSRPIFVAEVDGIIKGYAFCVIQKYENNNILTDVKTLYIDDLCVDENSRGENIGKSLYEYVVNYAKTIGCYNVTLNVWEGNDSAKGFYESLGMKVQKTGMEIII